MVKPGTPLVSNKKLPIDRAMLEEIARDEKLNLESETFSSLGRDG
jgi:hypothetical protein